LDLRGLAFTFVVVTFSFTPSAGGDRPCGEMSYQSRNQVDYGPIRVRRLAGKATDRDGVAVPGVCVGLFTEADHRLVTATETRPDGYFNLRDVPKGDYRLVAEYEAFGAANARVRIGRRGTEHTALWMIPPGIGRTSYFERK
jgi:hypothetical protein